MPYSGPDDPKLPEYIQELTEDDREQWVTIWNSAFEECMENEGKEDECEKQAFAIANGEVLEQKSSPIFVWDTKTRRFRWKKDGRFVSTKQMQEEREAYLEREKEINQELTDRLFQREITLSKFEQEFKRNLVRVYTVQYILAIGGRENMTFRDWGIIGAAVKKQYRYANQFLLELAQGRYTEGQARAVALRMGLYTSSSTQMYERAKVEGVGQGQLVLPAYPGDGSTICLSNDRCHWRIVEKDHQWECYWVLEASADHCATCLERSQIWNPFVVPK